MSRQPSGRQPSGRQPSVRQPGGFEQTKVTTADGTISGSFSEYGPTREDLVSILSNYEICDRTGFKARLDELVEQWDGKLVLPHVFEQRHPQEFVRAVPERTPEGPLSPEPEDTFLSTNEISASDL